MIPPLPPLPLLLQSLYTLAAASILLANSIPALQRRFVGYGKTAPPAAPSITTKGTATGLLDKLAAITVPHTWFTHFYVSAVVFSVFWMMQILARGGWYQVVAGMAGAGAGAGAGMEGTGKAGMGKGKETGMKIEQVVLAWACFVAQVGRRLYECLYVQKSGGASRMWVAHYLVGLLFYAAMAVGVWVEGTAAIDAFKFSPTALKGLVNAPSLKSFVGLILLFVASGAQHDCHTYLASLKKYSLPTHTFFRAVVCPHYTAEVVIYLAISVIAAPRGAVVNTTVFAGAVFVAAILSVSAGRNREWYRQKFGEEAVRGKWCIIPGVY